MKKVNQILSLIALLFLFTPLALADDVLMKKVKQLESMLQLYLNENQRLKKQLEDLNKSSQNQKNNLPQKLVSIGSEKPIDLFEQCAADIENCWPITLCELATYRSVSYQNGNLVEGNEWVKGNKNKKFVDEAKRRGLACDLESDSNKLAIEKLPKIESKKPKTGINDRSIEVKRISTNKKPMKVAKTRSIKSGKHWLFDRKFTNFGPKTNPTLKILNIKFCSGEEPDRFFYVWRDAPFGLFYERNKWKNRQDIIHPVSIRETNNSVIMTYSLFSKFRKFQGKMGAVVRFEDHYIYERERDRVRTKFWQRHLDGSIISKPRLNSYLYHCD